jgi:ribosome maturation factor RimP
MTDVGMKHKDPLVTEISALVEPVVTELGYELVEVQFRREQHGQVLRVVIFRPAGVNIDDCARVSREAAHLLEVEDLIDQAYNLEVTSPGLDWELVSERDFARYRGKKVKVVLLDSPEPLIGQVGEVGDGQVFIEVDGESQAVSLDLIKKAKLVIEF